MKELDRKNFAIFVLTHGRPNHQATFNTFRQAGYTGDVYFIIDNEDSTADQYFKDFGDKVIQFDKAKSAELFDIADTQTDRRATVFARNQSFIIAKELGLDYFMQVDDDYSGIYYKYQQDGKLKGHPIKSLDSVFDALIDFLEDSNAITIAMAQSGDFLGGVDGSAQITPLKRKAMNTWLFRTERPLNFVGRMNDDVNTYVINGMRGELILFPMNLSVTPIATQSVAGGMTEMYLDAGTYMKSMYTVMMAPSCVTVRGMGKTNIRPHHHISWNYCVPKIISDKHCKTK